MSNALFRLLILFDKKKSEDILKDLNNDIEMHFVMTRWQRQTSTLDAKSHRIEVVLKAYLKKNKIIIKVNQDFKKNLKKEYAADHTWNKILQKLQIRKTYNDITDEINFIIHDELLYYFSLDASWRLVISSTMKKKVS